MSWRTEAESVAQAREAIERLRSATSELLDRVNGVADGAPVPQTGGDVRGTVRVCHEQLYAVSRALHELWRSRTATTTMLRQRNNLSKRDEAREMWQPGMSLASIAREIGASKAYVQSILDPRHRYQLLHKRAAQEGRVITLEVEEELQRLSGFSFGR